MHEPSLALHGEIPVSLREPVADKLALAAHERVPERLRAGDATLWGPAGSEEIANRLGWLTIAERMLGEVEDLRAFADEVRDEGIRDVVLLGMGGSSLAPEVLRRCFAPRPQRPRLHVLDSTDSCAIRAVTHRIEPRRTLFLVSSKSGGTIEPLSLFAHFWSLVGEGQNFVAITDPGSGLAALAGEHRFRRVFLGDPNIGGRYSALSPFGLVPGALIGLDLRALLAGAAEAWQTGVSEGTTGTSADLPGVGVADSAAVVLGATLSALARAGRDKLTFLISASLPGLGLWLEQLVAESTGKSHTGILPVAEEPPGDAEDYGEDRVFAYLPDRRDPDPTLEKLVRALAEAGHPAITIPTRGPSDLGRVFQLFELAVAVAGWGLEINPFDQPNVQQAKDATKRVLDQYEARHELTEAPDADAGALSALLKAGPPSYVAIMGYVEPSGDFDAAVAELRVTVRSANTSPGRATTTFGYGPRFLHSTGQFHKGGPKGGRFLQLLHDGPADVEIPGAPYTFTTLKNAEAIGDLQTLRELGLPAERVRLRGEDCASALRALTARIKETL
ncbi:MAG: glucose-6-phosphate isomerase [Actinomycetota bacterium]|nr:glucose-6-phosphate isomerase [Actinomycetota bacterium]